jgi:peptidylprolyl isomerase
MNSSKIKLLISLFVSLLILAGCETPVHKGFKKTNSGIYYKIHTEGNTDTTMVRTGSILTVNMVYSINDSVLFDSKNSPTATRLQMMESRSDGDIYEAFGLLSQGDSATLIVDAMTFFTKTMNQPTPPEFVSEGDEMMFEVEILSVQSQEQAQAEAEAEKEKLKLEEPKLIEQYIVNNNITLDPNESGIYYIEQTRGSGNNPGDDSWVSVHYNVRTLAGEKLFNTRDQTEDPLSFKIGNRFENEGFQEVVKMMREGGVANALVPSEKAFGAQGAGQIVPPYTPLFYEIELIDVMTQAEYEQKQAEDLARREQEKLQKIEGEKDIIQQYLAENNITPTEIHEDGIIYVETEKGTGPTPQSGQKVKVHYTGMLLDGSVFDSSIDRGMPFEFVLGQGRVIQGWDKGIPFINVGGKGTLIIPFDQGYGERGSGNSIPPYSTLVFDIEVLEVINE